MRTYRVEIVVHVTKYHGIHGAVYLTWYSTVCCPKIPWYFYYVIAFEALYCGRGRYFCHCIFPRQALTTAVLRWHRLMCERLY